MTKRMLIDATHAEETRVVVLDGNRLEDFDVETSTKRQLKGNIYLAKVIRVEPSLQAAFVEYGGGRHGFLAFSEIHPDYYQIPVADRQRLLELQAQEAREEEEAEDAAAGLAPSRTAPARHEAQPEIGYAEAPEIGYAEAAVAEAAYAQTDADSPTAAEAAPVSEATPVSDEAGAETEPEMGVPPAAPDNAPPAPAFIEAAVEETPEGEAPPPDLTGDPAPQAGEPHVDAPDGPRPAQATVIERDEKFGPFDEAEPPAGMVAPALADEPAAAGAAVAEIEDEREIIVAAESDVEIDTESQPAEFDAPAADLPPADMPPPQTVGGDNENADSAEDARERRMSRLLRNYRIQEVIKRRQIMLVQVVKEERGTKGAALTSYISLAGRFCVLMPNSPRGGGISRKITSAADRRRLKEITAELEIPQGMGLIVRTAGANRPKQEIKRDCEYLMRLWDDIREHTMRSVAPALIYEEASLIKRAIRDVYSRDIDEIIVDGEEGWKAAHDFMRMLMPSHAKKVQLWRGPNGQGGGQPLFAKHQVEQQLDAMLSPTVQLRSGGYIVINQTEALVAIDVNSGRATRERGIEETALRTNLEAADEVARQLRLRDLAGLIVIDFIDMESKKHNAMVERRLTEALKVDRARIQVGHISHFGLMEMSRQRLRPSLAETSFMPCPHCGGTGHVRSVESSAIHVLRAIEDECAKGRASLIRVHVASAVGLYLLNHKRDRLADIERRYATVVHFEPDDSLIAPQVRIDRLRPPLAETERAALERPAAGPVAPAAPELALADDEDTDGEDEGDEEAEGGAEAQADAAAGTSEDSEHRRRRRRRRRGGRRDQPATADGAESAPSAVAEGAEAGEEPNEAEDDGQPAVAVVDPAEAEQPEVDASETEAQRSRRRGRRGGRRRRGRESDSPADAEATPTSGEAAEDEAPPPAPSVPGYARPAYSGPTPADPFGGQAFDIFDILEQAEAARPAPPTHVPGAAAAAAAPALELEDSEQEAAPLVVEPMDDWAGPERAAALPALPPEPQVAAAPEQADHAPEPVLAVPPEPAEPALTAAEPDPPPTPAIRPILVGEADTPPAERKRGWWRR